MKLALFLMTLAMAQSGFAAGTFSCQTSHHVSMRSTVNNEAGSVPFDFSFAKGRTAYMSYPDAVASHYESAIEYTNGKAPREVVKLLVITDKNKGVLAVIRNENVYVDQTGAYTAKCQFEY